MSPFGLLDRWLAPAPDPARIGWLKGAVYAHRGLHGTGDPAAPDGRAGLPENSPSAFAAAIAQGLGIECDIQCARDRQPMVFHDYLLDRLTDESGPVAQRSGDELQRIMLRGSTDAIPSLRQMLDQVAGQVPLLIEIKSARRGTLPTAEICNSVRHALTGYRGDHAVMSFDPRIVRWFARHAPHIVRGLVMTEEHDQPVLGSLRRHLALWHGRPDFLAYDVRDLPSPFAAAQRGRGLPVLTWTVRSAGLRAVAAAYADAPIAEGAGVA